LSYAIGGGRGKERRGDSSILVGKLLILKGCASIETIMGGYSPLEAKGCDLPLSREEVNLTPLVVIASATRNPCSSPTDKGSYSGIPFTSTSCITI